MPITKSVHLQWKEKLERLGWFLTTFTQLTARLKNFLRGWWLILGLVEFATVCVKSEVILDWLMILAVVMAMIAICIVASDDSLVDYLAKLKNIPPILFHFPFGIEYLCQTSKISYFSFITWAKWSTRNLWQYILTYVMPAFPTTQYSNKDTIIIADENQFCPIFYLFF